MSLRALFIEPSICTGCRTCEMACSLSHEGKCSPHLSRTRVIKYEALGMNYPMVCYHCSKPSCMAVCLEGAIKKDDATGAVVIDETLCKGCRTCITACPYSQISFNPEKEVAFKCDLCGGDPQCAKFCPSGAITYSDIDEYLMARRRALVDRSMAAIQVG